MPAIKATNSRGLKIINCRFSGFETDIEIDNVKDFLSKGNAFSYQNTPQRLINDLVSIIHSSPLADTSKKKLFREIIAYLSTGAKDVVRKQSLSQNIGSFLGNVAVDYFVQLAAAVSAGLIIRQR